MPLPRREEPGDPRHSSNKLLAYLGKTLPRPVRETALAHFPSPLVWCSEISMSNLQVAAAAYPDPVSASFSEEAASLPIDAHEVYQEDEADLDVELEPLTDTDSLQTVETDDAQEAVANWRISAVGN